MGKYKKISKQSVREISAVPADFVDQLLSCTDGKLLARQHLSMDPANAWRNHSVQSDPDYTSENHTAVHLYERLGFSTVKSFTAGVSAPVKLSVISDQISATSDR